ncbi:leucyl/phenylalanyl-tRNA--protein transferase [Flavobacterium sp. xlx-214]|uniref:leucyl/phenylalanyl-tRNA--protein transferase n=1 Tax=unclassified Flavobacterium TaxID=196869 RepID=UPI0013D3FF16|nr:MULTISPECIES: leucyl/phenylalanyl-tRNA--protein transferase [unclassified Flavobacterium]MBA5792989.1 leucyl/phenylalanyl-tRNA--protein transferase [Flavobacterium sp. xlx-221]QMI84681.1 leucyl/phenylalanyl-tRNA--protein transferase [Flavobacterium sp. xlx-214]
MYQLTKEHYFPQVETAHSSGIVAFGGDLSTERLLLAYKSGIFPWFEDGEAITWFAPEERMVLFLNEVRISKSTRNILNRSIFKVTYNEAFHEVIKNCQEIKRSGQLGTWITDDMLEAYTKLHELGYAKSVEVWQDDELVGGLYGIDLGHIFCGESMFSKVSNASKIAFIHLAEKLKTKNYQLIDCQVYNDYLAQLGCEEIPRDLFMQILKKEVKVVYED